MELGTQRAQDMMLVGPAGPLPRWLALLYCRLTMSEGNYSSMRMIIEMLHVYNNHSTD